MIFYIYWFFYYSDCNKALLWWLKLRKSFQGQDFDKMIAKLKDNEIIKLRTYNKYGKQISYLYLKDGKNIKYASTEEDGSIIEGTLFDSEPEPPKKRIEVIKGESISDYLQIR